MAILCGDISDIILKKKDCTTLEKVEWICTVSLRLVEWFSPYPQTLLNKSMIISSYWSPMSALIDLMNALTTPHERFKTPHERFNSTFSLI